MKSLTLLVTRFYQCILSRFKGIVRAVMHRSYMPDLPTAAEH